jgi:NAD(P)-dependent dehydrogenase (short-subunit alcohol dehydrogenase family)
MTAHSAVPLTCWVTGASSGLGREIVLELARLGHRVIATARQNAALDELCTAAPGKIIPLVCDVTDEKAMSLLLDKVPQLGHLDVLVVSAGICEYLDAADLDTSALRRVMETNFFGAVNACKTALPWLLKDGPRQQAPQIIAISSLSTVTGFPRNEAYGSSKAAFEYFLDALRCDLGRQVVVTTVRPGFIRTPLTAGNDFPMPWLMQADEAARQVMKILGSRRRRFAFPWQLDWVLGLARLLPGLWYGPVMNHLLHQRRTKP